MTVATNVPPYTPPEKVIERPLTPHPFLMPPVATPHQLAKAHQIITLHNTHECQPHLFRDRYLQYHMVKPGEKIEIDMCVDEIANQVYQSTRNDRGFHTEGPLKGKPFALHPVKVIGVTAAQSHADPRDTELAMLRAKLAELEKK